jgi:hypothetical protein
MPSATPSQGPPDFEAAAATLGITEEVLQSALGVGEPAEAIEAYTVTINGVEFEIAYELFTWDELPDDVIYERQPIQIFTGDDGVTRSYEAVYVSSGNLNWYQAAFLAQDAGGYLASITSEEENTFVFNLVDDGGIDKDPRPNDQPNDSGDEEGSQPIMGFGEMNVPVPTWGDYMDAVGTYGETRLPGQSYGFVIEYES